MSPGENATTSPVYRLRAGEYHLALITEDERLLILMPGAGHWSKVYRQMICSVSPPPPLDADPVLVASPSDGDLPDRPESKALGFSRCSSHLTVLKFRSYGESFLKERRAVSADRIRDRPRGEEERDRIRRIFPAHEPVKLWNRILMTSPVPHDKLEICLTGNCKQFPCPAYARHYR